MRPLKQIQRFISLGIVLALFYDGATLAQTSAPAQDTTVRPGSAVKNLDRDLNDIFSDPNFSNATWGVAIRSLETGEWLYRQNENKSLLPASNFKLFTAAEALSLLGPEFHFTTQLVTSGKISDGVLHGDVIIRGAGDPTFGSESMYPDSNATWVYDAWADSLKALGIQKIDGSIIGDDTYFSEDLYPNGWAIEDMPYYFAMQTSGLAFDEDQVNVTVSPGLSKGSSVRYELSPNTEYINVENRGTTRQDSIVERRRRQKDTVIATGYTSIDISRDAGSNLVLIKGQIPVSATATHQQLSIENPALYAATVFREVLDEHGLVVTGKTRTGRDLAKPIQYLKTRPLANYISPPLSAIVSVMNKESDNLYAEQLFRTLGKEIGGEGSFSRGIEVMKKFMASISVDTSRVAVYDGSGLSRMDLVSAGQMIQMLQSMYDRPRLFAAFYSSLAIMGVDGTLANRMKGTDAEGNVHAKTGFVTGVRSVSGYLTTKDGELLAFSMIANNHTVPVRIANNLQDLVLLRLVNFSRK